MLTTNLSGWEFLKRKIFFESKDFSLPEIRHLVQEVEIIFSEFRDLLRSVLIEKDDKESNEEKEKEQSTILLSSSLSLALGLSPKTKWSIESSKLSSIAPSAFVFRETTKEEISRCEEYRNSSFSLSDEEEDEEIEEEEELEDAELEEEKCFSMNNNLRKTYCSSNEKALKTCSKCKKEFASSKYLMYRHIKVCHGDVETSKSENPMYFNTFKCSLCSKEYRTFSHYVHHVSFCGDSKSIKESFFWKGKNVCGKCGQVFNSISEKRNSNHFCSPEKHFKCPKCSYSSYYPRHLKDHYDVKHGKRRNYICESCGKTFAYRTAFQSHIKIHGEKTHECSLCLKRFHSKTNLDLHFTTHESKEIPCEICGKIFPNSTYLNRHKSTQHPPDGVFKKFSCPYCPGSFREKKYTKKHVRSKHPGMSTNF